MVGSEFTPKMCEQGALLTQRLLETGLTVRASLWLFEPRLDSWRLLLGISEVDRRGPIEIYKIIRSIIARNGSQLRDLELTDISVLSPKDSRLNGMPGAVRVPKGGVRFSRSSVGGRFVEDAYIYRLSRAAA